MNREWVIIAILGVPSEVLELISFRSTKWKPFTFISWYTDVMPGVSKILTFSLMVLAMTFFWFILLFLYFVSKFQDLDWSALRSNLQWNFDTLGFDEFLAREAKALNVLFFPTSSQILPILLIFSIFFLFSPIFSDFFQSLANFPAL